MNLIQEGINKGLIRFDDKQKYITYIHQNKRRNYNNPEEKVQAESFLKLILIYGYKPERIKQFVSIKIGSDSREADIIVYNNDEHTSAHIVVECKKEDVSELELNQAIAQAFSYAATGTVRAKYFWVTSKIKDTYFEIPKKEPKKYLSVPDVPQYGIDTLAKFKYAKGGGNFKGQKLFELDLVSEDELTRRFKQAHNSLWGGGELNPSEAFDELDKLIFCKIWDERKARKKGEAYDFQIFSEKTETKTNQNLQQRINILYAEGRKKDPEVFKDDIRLNPEKLRTVVSYLESIHLSNTDLDSKGRAFETFMGSFFRGDFGQYFTPRAIVKFIVDTLPIKHDSLVLDTSCGSGGFLLHALDKVRQQASEYYPDFETNPKEAQDHYKHWHDFAEKNLYGIEINEQIARTAKMNMIIHDDGHTNVIATDGLLPVDDIKNKDGNISQQGIYSRTQNRGFAYGRFDFIITNPPFGSNIKQTEQAYMQQYAYAQKNIDWLNSKSRQTARDNQSTEILFIEQCHNFLTEGGYLAMVIPDGILTNSSLQYVRDGIEEKFYIIAVISMPQTAFQATGAGVKSSILFLKKHTTETSEQIINQKTAIQDSIKAEHDYLTQLQQIDQTKKKHIKELKGFDSPTGLQSKALTQSEPYKEWKKQVNAEYKEKIDTLKESLSQQYLEQKQKVLNNNPIFMAIAEDIGYDATGKPTHHNDLDMISKELAQFITSIEKKNLNFQLSSELDRNRVFFVQRCELKNRLDPLFYVAVQNIKNNIEKKAKYRCDDLIKSCSINRGRFGHRPRNDPRFYGGEYPFIQTGDIVKASDSNSSIEYTQTLNEMGLKTSKLFYPPKLLFTIAANIGDTAILDYPSCFPDSLVALIPKNDDIYLEYLNIYLRLIKPYIVELAPYSAQRNLNNQQLAQVPIVIPPKEIQAQIVTKMDSAYTDKKQKEAEAQRLLKSIDNYLLGELGIELPKQKENIIQSRIFIRHLSDISGGRFDPFFHSLNKQDKSSKYKFYRLKE